MSDVEEDTLDTLVGVRFLQRLNPLLARLRGAQCERDKAGNRELFYDQLCALILLTFFNPSVKSLRNLEGASQLSQVRKKLRCGPTSLTSLSEAMQVFDPTLLVEIVQDLLGQIPDSPSADPRLKQLGHVATAVDGTLLRKLPQVTQACFSSRTDRGWKLHTHLEILRGVPIFARVTDGSGQGAASEKAVLKSALQSDRSYILDRAYEEFSLFNEIVATKSSYVCRVKNDHYFRVDETRPLTSEALAAGIQEDSVGCMGSPNSKRIEHPDHLQRRIVVRVPEHPKRGGRRRTAALKDIVLVTSLLDVPAEIIVLLYRYRWLIELFFRWLKCVLSCRHLISQSENGIQIQMYCALIACLLIQLAGGPVKPNQWTYKLICLHVQGLATEEELLEHLRERAKAAQKKSS
jgi:hypothetical protein